MQLVDLPLSVGVLDLPHPLLSDDVDLERIGRRPVHREEEVGPPEEKREGDEERNHRPGDFELQRALDSAGELRLRPPPILDREVDDRERDQRREEEADEEQVEVEMVDVRRHRGGLFRKEREGLSHASPLWEATAVASRRRSLRHISRRNTTSPETMATPPRRTMFITTAP